MGAWVYGVVHGGFGNRSLASGEKPERQSWSVVSVQPLYGPMLFSKSLKGGGDCGKGAPMTPAPPACARTQSFFLPPKMSAVHEEGVASASARAPLLTPSLLLSPGSSTPTSTAIPPHPPSSRRSRLSTCPLPPPVPRRDGRLGPVAVACPVPRAGRRAVPPRPARGPAPRRHALHHAPVL